MSEYSRLRNTLDGAAAACLLLGVVGAVATIATWLKLERWPAVCSWAGLGSVALFGVGCAIGATVDRMIRRRT